LALVACGFTRKEAREVLGISQSTQRVHMAAARARLRCGTIENAIVEVGLRWLHTPWNGRQAYLDDFDHKLAAARARRTRDARNPTYPDLDDLIKGVFEHP